MANTATSVVDLDFQTIKGNLQNYLSSQNNIKDYNFLGSNMNTLLDVLAYNTYLNNFYANMIANEMFLDTAQIRDSIISHAKELNYLPRSASSSKATVNVKVIPTDNPGTVTIPKWHKFTTTIAGATKTFSTQSDHIITKSEDANGDATWVINNIELYEGQVIEEFFTVTTANNFVADLSNQDIDIDHLEVNIRISNTSSINSIWSKADTLFGLTDSSNSYFIEPAKDNLYRITFGDGVFGKKPQIGNIIKAKYRVSSKKEGDNGKVFSSASNIDGYGNVLVTTVINSIGGAEPEDIESIRINAPKSFQVQERAVTSNDYEILAKREFPNIQNVLAFGGEELATPRYGKVILAVDMKDADGVPASAKKSISDFFSKRTPLGIDVEVVQPEFTFIEVVGDIAYNISVTTQTAATIQSKAQSALLTYANNNINSFESTYRHSKALAGIDNSDTSIISSQLRNRIFKKLTPSSTTASSYELLFDNELEADDLFNTNSERRLYLPAVESSLFTYGTDSNAFLIDNGSGILKVVKLDTANKFVELLSDAGSVNYTTGKVEINSILIPAFSGGILKVFARVKNKDITSKQATILQLNSEDIILNVNQERL